LRQLAVNNVEEDADNDQHDASHHLYEQGP
jgi:hypothetical protein